MTRQEIITFLIWRSIGNFLVLFAVFGVFATFGPALYFEVQFRVLEIKGVTYTVAEKKPTSTTVAVNQSGFQAVMSNSKEQLLVPKDTDFGIVIPKIGANSNVIPNIDASNPDDYLPALQKGVAHAKGSVFPGMKGNVYLFAHSTDNFWDVGRYNAIFYLLKDLTPGDDVTVFFENVRHNYTVTQTKIVDPDEVSYLTHSHTGGEEQLILQTCWPPGTSWKRIIVVAKPK